MCGSQEKDQEIPDLKVGAVQSKEKVMNESR